jgi:hypothetical protein
MLVVEGRGEGEGEERRSPNIDMTGQRTQKRMCRGGVRVLYPLVVGWGAGDKSWGNEKAWADRMWWVVVGGQGGSVGGMGGMGDGVIILLLLLLLLLIIPIIIIIPED